MANFVTGELTELTAEQQQQRELIVAALVEEAGLPAAADAKGWLIRQVWPDQQQESVRTSLTAAVAAKRPQ